MSLKQNDTLQDQLREWLGDFGALPSDVLINGNGEKFIMVETENGTPGENGYGFSFERVLLPDEFQELD